MSRIQMIVFDMAGTTVRDDGGVVNTAFREALGACACDDLGYDEINAVMGMEKRDAIRRLLRARVAEGGGALEERVDAVYDEFVARMVEHYRTAPGVGTIDGAEDTFAALRALGVKVALDTGFPRVIADTILARLQWGERHIDASITSDEVANGRPSADMIRALMVRLGVRNPASVAKVGDTPADLDEGVTARCGLVVGVTFGSHTVSQLAAHPSARLPQVHLIGDIREVVALVRAGGTDLPESLVA
jgi:phosphonatase-like hydrolase